MYSVYYLPPNNLLVFISYTAFQIISFPFELHTCSFFFHIHIRVIVHVYNYIMFVSHTCTHVYV